MVAPLRKIRVLELGRVFAAPWCGQVLGDLGAEVIKVEALDGDPMRATGTGVVADGEGKPTGDRSVFAAVNRNKKSITIDIATADGQALVRRLAATCDVFIENFKVGDLARRGLDYAAVRAVAPDIIYLSLTGYGQTGPYAPRPGMDAIVQGLSGYMSMAGEADGPPTASPVSIMDFSAGMHAAVGILAALYARDVDGAPGQYIDLSLHDAGLALVGYKLVAFLLSGEQPPRGSRIRGFICSGVWETADGSLQLTVQSDADFRRLCEAAERPDLLADPRYSDRWLRTDNQEPLLAETAAIMKTRTTEDWLGRFTAAGLMAGPVNTLAQAAADPQVAARKMIVETAHGAGGVVPLVGNPIVFSETPIAPFEPPPLLGEHTDSVLEGLGLTSAEIDRLRALGAIGSPRGPAA